MGARGCRPSSPGSAAGPGAVLVLGALALLASRPQALPAAPAAQVDLSLYAGLDGQLVTLPIMGDDPHGRKLLWAQAHHGLPILAGLGDHLPGHRPPGYAESIDQNEFLRALQQLSVGDQPQTTVPPEAFAALRDQGFTWVVLDRVAFRPGLERQWTAAWTLTLSSALGAPEKQTPGGAAWRIRVPDGPVVLPAIRSVEAGIQNEGLRPIHSRPGPTRP